MATTTRAIVGKKFDSLSLLALKVKPNVFDLSSGLGHISIRDQIVRAQILARDLPNMADGSAPSLLVVGAGVAGLAAAAVAAERNCDVCVVEAQHQPFAMQRGVTNRFVGPFMYEWPSAYYANQEYPPDPAARWPSAKMATPTWSTSDPISADQLAGELDVWLQRYMRHRTSTNLEIWCSIAKSDVMRFVRGFVAASEANLQRELLGFKASPLPTFTINRPAIMLYGHHAVPRDFTPDFVLLAAGMGVEQLHLPRDTTEDGRTRPYTGVPGPGFWGPDQLKSLNPGDRVGIFGGGDGALQDVLRVLTVHDHPLQTLAFLKDALACPDTAVLIQEAEEQLAPFEAQSRLTYSWTIGNRVFALVDHECKQLADRLANNGKLLARVASCLKKETGTLKQYVREAHFTKCYLLNRFMVHLLHACAPGSLNGRTYDIHFEHEPARSDKLGNEFKVGVRIAEAMPHTPNLHPITTEVFDHIAVRWGIDAASVPGGQMVSLTKEERGQRTSLGHVLLPHVLEDEQRTYP